MGRKKNATPKLNYDKMSSDLKFACWDLQYEMLIASKRLVIDELWLGETEDFIRGFRAGWKYRENLIIGKNEIFDEIFGKD